MSFSGLDPARARHHVLRTIRQGFLGESRAAVAVREQIADFLARHGTQQPPPPILLRGEVGVGKSLLARLIHRAGPRPDGPYVEFHCAAIPDTLLEAELFGDERGALTGAPHAKPGAFQAANHGTLFLDLVTALPDAIQAKLLKVIEERSLRRLSSMRDEPLDVWILTATHEDLRAGVDYHRRYREAFNLEEPYVIESLYQQLGQLDLLIPPLRQRAEDILSLAGHFLAHCCAENHLPPKSLAPDALSELLSDTWAGNVRQIEFVMKRVALRFREQDTITAAMLALAN